MACDTAAVKSCTICKTRLISWNVIKNFQPCQFCLNWSCWLLICWVMVTPGVNEPCAWILLALVQNSACNKSFQFWGWLGYGVAWHGACSRDLLTFWDVCELLLPERTWVVQLTGSGLAKNCWKDCNFAELCNHAEKRDFNVRRALRVCAFCYEFLFQNL